MNDAKNEGDQTPKIEHKQVRAPWLNAIINKTKTEEGRLMDSAGSWAKSLEGTEMTLGNEKEESQCVALVKVKFGKVHIFEMNTLKESIEEMVNSRYDQLCSGTGYTRSEAIEIYWNLYKDRVNTCKRMGAFELAKVEVIYTTRYL